MSSSIPEKWLQWPDIFLANRIDELSFGIYKWRTLKNLRCKGKIPEECFMKASPRKILIVRDKFFAWIEDYARV